MWAPLKGLKINCSAKCNHLSVEYPLQFLCQANNDRNKLTFCTGFLLVPFAEKKIATSLSRGSSRLQ